MPPKRKRNERVSEGGGGRPAPHRPSDTSLGQHDRDFQDGNPSQNRRGSGGGRTTRRNADRRDSSNNRGPVSPSLPRPSSSSSQAAPLTIPSTPLAPQPIPPRSPVPSNYNYLILTEARLSAWDRTGRQEVVEHGVKSRIDEDIEEISTISQEFARAVLENRLNPGDAGNCLKTILGPEVERADGSEFAFDAQTLFLDTISIFVDSEDSASKPQLRDLVAATEISPKLLREVLDAPALQQLGLIRDTFVKFGIRYATNQLYRQANFNLLREESEGYSKLAAELYRTPYHSPGHHDFALVQACWERVKALIGTFDLDVGRVLDVVIDVFSATMLRNIIFFSRFLRISSWWPRNQVEHAAKVFAGGLPKWALPENENASIEDLTAELSEQRHQRDLTFWDRARNIHLDAFFELGGRRVDDADLQRFADMASDSNQTLDSSVEWMRSTKTLPPCGNRVAAQLLGFKFRFYASDARDKGETLPANLYYLAAFLIKIGFIALPDLYPHLWPADEQMETLRDRRQQEIAEKDRAARQGNEPNALLAAGALTDDTLPTLQKPRDLTTPKADGKEQEAAAKKAEEEAGLPEPKEAPKADLVSHLLVVGALPEALFILGRFPWLPEAYPDEIYPPINRILLHSISQVYQDARPTEIQPTTTSLVKPDIAQDQTGMPKGTLRLVDGTPIKILKWPHSDGISKGTLYRFYLDDWADNIPVCQTVDDVFTLCNTLLNISGVNIGRDPVLVKKLAVIGVKSYLQDQSPENVDRWHDFLRRILVPSLSLTKANVDTVAAVWDLLKHYPTPVRYNIYAECYEGQISRLPAMTRAFKNARLDTLATLKRLSLENVPESAKKLAKIALSSPGVVCKVALDQIEAYTNLIEAFVECTKYFTEMGHDVLVWSLLSSLGGKQRSKTQETSILLTSRWLQALSRFSGKVFRRYDKMDPTPVLQYVNDQVARGNSTDLVILEEFINSMGGIVPDIDFTDAQLSALSGGDLLRRQTLVSLGDKRYESGRSASRLMRALVDTGIASTLLTNMAQYRQSAIYRLPESETHIKYLATVVDDSQQALVQYVELLRSNLTPERFNELVPDIPSLMTDYGLDANLAFLIGRASLTYLMTGAGGKLPVGDTVGDVNGNSASAAITPAPDDEDRMLLDDQELTEGATEQPASAVASSQKSDRFLDVLSPITNAVGALLPPSVWNKMSPEFFVLFWSLQTGDLDVPVDSYEAEKSRLKKEHDELKKDRSDLSRTGEARNKARMSSIEQLQKDLDDEKKVCQERMSKTKLLLIKQSPIWFSSSAKTDAITDIFIEECLLPRLLLSPGDADFCHRMVKFLHSSCVSNFKLSNLYDRFFSVNRLRAMIFACTVREAEFLGRFIKLTLGDLSQWHQKKAEYEKQATQNGRLGFATAFDEHGKPVSFMEHDQFRDLLWTWHRNLSMALRTCLGGTEWMHIRNAITILKAILEHFPAVDFMGRQFQQSLAKIAEREAAPKMEDEDGQGHRGDLAVTANTAISALKKFQSKWVMVQAFRSNTSGDSAEDKKAAESSKTAPPSNLRANAAEFKPQTTSAPTRTKANAEEEDGEVKDVKAQSATAQTAGVGTNETESTIPLLQRDSNQCPASMITKSDSRSLPTRSSTPKLAPSTSIPGQNAGQDLSRTSNFTSTSGGNVHGLPNRPEVPFPAAFTHDKFGQIKTAHARDHREVRETREPRDQREPRELWESRDPRDPSARDSRNERDPRPFRPTEDARPIRGREHQVVDRRVSETTPRESSRSERDRQPHRSDARRVEPTLQDRTLRERVPPSSNTSRGAEVGRTQRESPAAMKSMPPPPAPDPQGPTVNPERARLIGSDRPDSRSNMINPERAALIGDPRPPARQIRDESRDRNSPRAPSPRRDRVDSRASDTNRDERPSRSHRADHHVSTREHRSESQSSTGPRGRLADHDSDRPRDSSAFAVPTASRGESDHGRLTNQDPDYGRLSSIPSIADMGNPPEGPRGRGRNAARATTGNPPVRPEPRFQGNELHRPSSPDRNHPPTGPASSRPRRNQPGGQHSHMPLNSPANSGPPSTGIHPDRLRQFNPAAGPAASPPQSSYQAPAPAPVSVHPDRMNQISSTPSLASNSHPGSRSLPPLQTPERPSLSGPPSHRQPSANHQMTPAADNSGPMTAPTGPSAANDRARTGGRRQLSGINNILQGGPNVRSKNSRSNLAGSDAQVLTGASPVTTPVHERPESILLNERAGRNDHERGRRDHENADRSSRTRRGSRERSSERELRSKDPREYRDRKPGTGAPSHGREGERESSRRSGREQANANRDPMHVGGRSDLMSNGRDGPREPRHRGDGGGGRHEDYGRSGGGRGGGPRGEDRRESRGGPEERGRKRRSEEFGASTEKRQRR
ncbi:transcription factor/nuclear export subunit protein 2-domain-containing protein [Biscogniauxia mediterranea]|nr:transcription factor/nuclear export subunit protein 2-domain-containing protein [Biscogniauxia mediterranea]